MDSSATIFIQKGTLDTNGNTLNIGSFNRFGTSTAVLTLGASIINLSDIGTPWQFATPSGLTFNQGTSVINLTYNGSSALTFAGGGLTYNNVTIAGGSTGTLTFTGSNTFNVLTINHPKAIVFPASTTTTVGTFAAVGASSSLVTITSSSSGTAATLSQAGGQVCSDWLSLKDSTVTGGASWYAGANSTNVSGNTGWTFTACPAGTNSLTPAHSGTF